MDAESHRALAVEANNSTWELLDGRNHTAAEADELLQRSYAAAYHWARASDTTAANAARASWLVSRCHATLGHGDVALHHGHQCAAAIAQDPDVVSDFDHAYAHEAIARALACLGRNDEASVERERALAVSIADDEDRTIVLADIAQGPWFGLSND